MIPQNRRFLVENPMNDDFGVPPVWEAAIYLRLSQSTVYVLFVPLKTTCFTVPGAGVGLRRQTGWSSIR